MSEIRKHRKAALRRLLALCMAAVLTAGSVSSALAITQADIDATAAEIASMKAEQQSLKSQADSIQAELDDLQEQENTAVDQMLLYQDQVDVLEGEIFDTKAIIADYEDQIADTEVMLDEAKEEEAEYYDLFCERVRSMEEDGSASYWSLLFNAENFNDLLDRITFVSEVMDYDNNVMDQLAAARQKVADTLILLEEEKAAKEDALAELQEEEAAAQEAYDQVELLYEEIQENEDVYAEKMAEVEAAQDELAADIVTEQALYQQQVAELEEQKRREEEARKAAEEAAKKKAAEEEAARQAAAAAAAASQQSTNTTTQQSTSTASDNTESGSFVDITASPELASTDTGTSTSTSTSTETSTETTTTSYTPSNSSIGASIASYACQFIGNPYVWGGTSLTNGCDCSGFVMAVYAHFGYSLPHSASGISCKGTGISYSNAQAGDIICYHSGASPTGWHTGIYIGGGQMVNAQSSKTGIVVSTVNTGKSGFTVRRVY